MEVSDKYISNDEVNKETSKDPTFKTEKIILSNDAYAISEFLLAIINKIEHYRTS